MTAACASSLTCKRATCCPSSVGTGSSRQSRMRAARSLAAGVCWSRTSCPLVGGQHVWVWVLCHRSHVPHAVVVKHRPRLFADCVFRLQMLGIVCHKQFVSVLLLRRASARGNMLYLRVISEPVCCIQACACRLEPVYRTPEPAEPVCCKTESVYACLHADQEFRRLCNACLFWLGCCAA